jgi:hypothetical protein
VSPEPGGGGSQLPPGAQKELGQAAAPQNQPKDQNRGMASGGVVDAHRTDVVSGGFHG